MVLPANQQIALGPYPQGRVLHFTAPRTTNAHDDPNVNGVRISLANLPKKVTLTAGKVHILAAKGAAVTYNLTATDGTSL